MIDWIFLDTGKNPGQFNMDFDLQLVDKVKSGKFSFLRFYQWQPYAISLGYHQKIESVNLDLCSKDGIDVVRRPTGGRAILHSEELTYSIVVNDFSFSPQEFYYKVNLALLEGLHLFNKRLKTIELEKTQVDFNSFYKSSRSITCFSSSAKNEIKFQNKKLVGSAQRVIDNVILQHGSILIGDYHKKIVDYLNLSNEEKKLLKKDLDDKTIALNDILKDKLDLNNLKLCLLRGFENIFEVRFNESEVFV